MKMQRFLICLITSLTMNTTSYADSVTINEADSGNLIEMSVGQTLILNLGSNPTTGYDWSYAGHSNSIITEQGKPAYTANQIGKGLVGGGGIVRWTFLAIKPGSESLKLEYKRPWEKDIEPVRTVFYHVKIK